MISKLFAETNKSFVRNIDKVILFSLPMLVAFVILFLVQIPIFPALGGIFLRIGSLPDVTPVDAGVMLVGYIVSLYLVSLVFVSINIIIKSQRATINVPNEVLKSMKGYTLNLFLIYVLMTLIWAAVSLVTYDIPYREFVTPLIQLILFIPLFYAPSALVIDNIPPEKALYKSVRYVFQKPGFFILWLVFGTLLWFVVGEVLQTVIPAYYPYPFIVINSLVLLPYLAVLQVNMYIAKYRIIG